MRVHVLSLVVASAACATDPPPKLSSDAKTETVEALILDRDARRDPRDGGGRAWLEPLLEGPIRVGSRQRFEILFEAGPLGIAEGGVVILQPSPFWGWDPPQLDQSEAPGYSEVVALVEASTVEIEVSTPTGEFLAARMVKGGLRAGERLKFVYGAGPAGARVDRYAESGAPIWLAVDGDGDGVRAWIDEVPVVDVVSAPPAQLWVTIPTTAEPGDRIAITIAALDPLGNAGSSLDEPVVVEHPGIVGLPQSIELSPRGTGRIELVVSEPGVYRVRASTNAFAAESNPLVVRSGVPRILWGDLHGHSQLSDGTGSPDDYFWYARDVAALDVVSLTDHDHWGIRFLDESPEMWQSIREAATRYDAAEKFVTILGYEWTSWLHGHRHVLFFGEEGGEVLSAMDEAYQTPALLWEALAGREAVTMAHHSAGGPVSTNWSYVPDPQMEPVTEIVSVHGSSEAEDAPRSIYSPVAGNFVRDVLDRGMQFGFIGSGDGHDGHPGLAHLGAPSGGLAAIFSEELSRDGVLDALRARRVYATNGPRIWLRVWLEEELRFAVAGTAPIERADIVRRGRPILSLAGTGRREWSETIAMDPLEPGDYVYVRIIQEDGGAAWSSPFFAE